MFLSPSPQVLSGGIFVSKGGNISDGFSGVAHGHTSRARAPTIIYASRQQRAKEKSMPLTAPPSTSLKPSKPTKEPQLIDYDSEGSTPLEASMHSSYEISNVNTFEELDVYRGLVLDLSYRPINVVCWKRALCLDILEKADVLTYYDQVVKSASRAFPIPAVLRVTGFVYAPKEKRIKLGLSRNNVFLRDKFRCQYCGRRDNLTIDHVKAISRGGGWSWDNLVTACAACNSSKGDKSPDEAGMKLAKPPREPRELDCKDLPPNYKTHSSLCQHSRTPAEWVDWLPIKAPNLPL